MGNETSATKKGPQSTIGVEGAHRNAKHSELLATYSPDVATMAESWLLAVQRYGSKPCLGSKWGCFINYDKASRRVMALGSGIKKLVTLPRQSAIGVFTAASSVETTLLLLAGNVFSWPVCALFDQSNAETVEAIVKKTGITVMVVGAIYTTFILDTARRMSSLKHVIQLEELRPGQRERAASQGITLLSFAEVELCGSDFSRDADVPQPEDVCSIVVSAGTTAAMPKITKFTHVQMLAQMSSLATGFWMMHASWDEVFMSFNSLAFGWERVLQECMFVTGSAIGFPAGSQDGILDDIRAMKPTFLAAIPQFFSFFSQRVSAGLAEYSFTTRNLFFQALESKKASLKADGGVYTSTVYDTLFFSPVRELLGGNLRLCITLGDYIDALALEFLRVTLCIPILCGYHTSETGVVTMTHRGDVQVGSLGAPLPGCELRLAPIEKLDVTGEYGEPGEICVRWVGSQDWHKTGDSGLWDKNGALHFVDRIEWSEMIDRKVFQYGRLSSWYSRNQWVRQIFLYRDKETLELSAVVVPDLFELSNYAASLISSFEGLVSTTDPAALLRHDGIRKMVLQSLQNTAREFGLQDHEVISKIRFQLAVFSQENHFLGVTLKLRRDQLEKVFNSGTPK